jgi:hypothetical protein
MAGDHQSGHTSVHLERDPYLHKQTAYSTHTHFLLIEVTAGNNL